MKALKDSKCTRYEHTRPSVKDEGEKSEETPDEGSCHSKDARAEEPSGCWGPSAQEEEGGVGREEGGGGMALGPGVAYYVKEPRSNKKN